MILNISTLILTTGLWRAVLTTAGGELPFQMKVDKNDSAYTLTVINGEEKILLDDVIFKDDSLIVKFPVYESELRMRIVNANELEGNYINLTRTTNSTIQVKAFAGNAPRFFNRSRTPAGNVDGRWSVMFSPGTKDSSYAVGVFKQDGALVSGTFLTASGDYRYLSGVMEEDSLFLSTFDGVFVYLFKAKVKKNTIDGMFYSGASFQQPWSGFRDESATLPDPDSLTRYNTGDQPFSFSFFDADSNKVSLSDSAFKNKVVVVQILGSWCPNCLDESAFLADYYSRNRQKGVEIIGLSFEKTDDFSRAAANVNRFKKKLRIDYTVLIASNRSKIKTVLPGFENFVGFPTTIFLDKSHKIRKIHAGFSGPATGAEYEKFKDDFSRIMDKLLEE